MRSFFVLRHALVVVCLSLSGWGSSALFSSEAGADADLILRLDKATGTQPISVYLAQRQGRLTAAFALGYNSMPHQVDSSGLRLQDGQVVGNVLVHIVPDPWLPADGKPFTARYALQAEKEKITFTGAFAGQDLSGLASLQRTPVRPMAGLLQMRVHQALWSLTKEAGVAGPNQKYALDMFFKARLAGHQSSPVLASRFESVVPDYRGYSAVVKEVSLLHKPGQPQVSLQWQAAVDHGGQGKSSVPRYQDYSYAWKGLVIADRWAGTCTMSVDGRETNRACQGHVNREPAPKLGESAVWLRLHAAMRQDYPVILQLSLRDADQIHGMALAPRYNHQVHAVDASGLVVGKEGKGLYGQVLVHVTPDCYHDQDRYFTLSYSIDVSCAHGFVSGSYKGRDGELQSQGQILGELRPLALPPASLSSVESIDCRISQCLPAAQGKGGTHARAEAMSALHCRLHLRNGRVERIAVIKPAGASLQDPRAHVRLQGNQVQASLHFSQVEGHATKAGPYTFTMQGIVNGERAFGYWRGFRHGQPILVKSSKFKATLNRPSAP